MSATPNEITASSGERGRSLLPESWNAKRIAARGALIVPAIILFAAANLLHATLRGFAVDVAPFDPINIAEWDLTVFRGAPTVWLQDLLGTTGFWTNVAFMYWSSLFWIPPVLVALVAATRGWSNVTRLILLQFVLVVTADIIYAIAPTRPPWMDLDVVRIVASRSDRVDVDANPYAALPSLHVAVPLAFALWFRALDRADPLRRLSPALFAWAIGMSWCVIYTGEHYVIDVVTGFAWATLAFFAIDQLGLLRSVADSTTQPVELARRGAVGSAPEDEIPDASLAA